MTEPNCQPSAGDERIFFVLWMLVQDAKQASPRKRYIARRFETNNSPDGTETYFLTQWLLILFTSDCLRDY